MIFTGFVLWDFCKTFDKSQTSCKETFRDPAELLPLAINKFPKIAENHQKRLKIDHKHAIYGYNV